MTSSFPLEMSFTPCLPVLLDATTIDVWYASRCAVLEQRVVVLQIEVMHLNPYAGNVDSIDANWEPAMGAMDVGADILDALYHPRIVMRNFVDVPFPAIAFTDTIEVSPILVNTVRPILGRNQRIHCGGHVIVVWRAQSLD
jgi:hypothetical protein